jgi:xanthine dehydrogenase accessory factor
MKEVTDDISAWIENGETDIALATVIRTWGSSPRQPGAKMAVNSSDNISGSVSGGCVEGAVIEAARETISTGKCQLLHFGVADTTAWDVGLACGGSIDVFLEKLDLSAFELTSKLIAEGQLGTILTIVKGPEDIVGRKLTAGESGAAVSDMGERLREQAAAAAGSTRQSSVVSLDNETDLFVDLIRPAPTLIAVGGGDIAIALTKMARLLGYSTVVIDPRRVFSAETRFPHVDRLVQKWPRSAFAGLEVTRDTAAALLTHDPKIDDPALEILLPSAAFYIGALGSRKTHAARLQRLAAMGFSAQQTERIRAPIGLEIGARSPQEIALAILAEVVAVRHGMEIPA